MVEKTKLNALIVGCGNIAGAFDENNDEQSLPSTHAGAYTRDGRFNLTACVEPNKQRRVEFKSFWQIAQSFSSIEQVLSSDPYFDVISICSPTSAHFSDLNAAIQLRPNVIFCEKPLASNLKEAESIVTTCKEANILLAVNYTRSWDPIVQQLEKDIKLGDWGELRSVIGTYNKGILNNGSHLLDLLFFLLGELHIVGVTAPVFDFSPDDPTVTALLQSSKGIPVHLVTANAQDYALFEIQLIFSKGILIMEDAGFKWRERQVEESKVFTGYRYLDRGEIKEGGYKQAMLRAVDNIYQAATESKPIEKTGAMAIKVQRLCEQIKQASLRKIDNKNDR